MTTIYQGGMKMDKNTEEIITLKLQILLNKKMFESGYISYNIYSKTNELLIIKEQKLQPICSTFQENLFN